MAAKSPSVPSATNASPPVGEIVVVRAASEARVVAHLEDCEGRKLKPATVGRRLASLAVVHGLLGTLSPTRGPIVRDALRGFRRRVDVAQRPAGPLRFGEGIGLFPPKGST